MKGSILEKCGKIWKKGRVAMARLGKYCMGGYGRIGVYRVNDRSLMGFEKIYLQAKAKSGQREEDKCQYRSGSDTGNGGR